MKKQSRHEDNEEKGWAEALSRLAEPGAGMTIPPELESAQCEEPPPRSEEWWLTNDNLAPPAELDFHERARSAATTRDGSDSYGPQPCQVPETRGE